MSKRTVLFLVVLALLLTACAPRASATPPPGDFNTGGVPVLKGVPAVAAPAAPPQLAFGSGAQSSESQANPFGNAAASSSDTVQRMVIQNASLGIIVPNPAKAVEAINKMAVDMGGFVVSSDLSLVANRSGASLPRGSITVRVPAEKLNDALTQIKALVKDPQIDVLNEKVTGQDVTKEYTDLNSRLVNLQMAEKQLQNIMDGATKTEDVLAVFNQLVSVREQIEVIQGQMKYYVEAAALSAIAVDVSAEASVAPLAIGSWQPVGVARDAIQTLVDVLQWLGSATIWIVIFCLPISILIAIPVCLVIWVVRRVRRNSKKHKPNQLVTGQPAPEATPTPPGPEINDQEAR